MSIFATTHPLGPDGPAFSLLDRLYKPRRLRKIADHRARLYGRTLRERAELVQQVLR